MCALIGWKPYLRTFTGIGHLTWSSTTTMGKKGTHFKTRRLAAQVISQVGWE